MNIFYISLENLTFFKAIHFEYIILAGKEGKHKIFSTLFINKYIFLHTKKKGKYLQIFKIIRIKILIQKQTH